MTGAKPLSELGFERFTHPDKFGQWMGYRPVTMDKGTRSAEMELTIREDHLSPSGRVHGGVISGFFDHACGAAVFTILGPKDACSTVELKVNYFRPIELGQTLRAKTRVVFHGKRICVIHGFIERVGEPEPVAMVTGTFNLIRSESVPNRT